MSAQSPPTVDDVRQAAAAGKTFHDDGPVILGEDSPTQEQLAEGEELGLVIDLKELESIGLRPAVFYAAMRHLAGGGLAVELTDLFDVRGKPLSFICNQHLQARQRDARRRPPTQESTPMTTATLLEIPIEHLHPRPENLRADANGDDLVPSIRAHGILQPLNVSANGNGWLINAGHRRLDGARKAGLEVVPCMVDPSIDDDTAMTFAMLIENMQRSDLSPIEQAHGFDRLTGYGVKQNEIATHVGVSASLVSRRLALLRLPEDLQAQIHAGELALETAERYGKLPADVMAIAITERWPEYRITKAVQAAEEQRLAAELQTAADELGLPLLVGVEGWDRLWEPIPDDETHQYVPLDEDIEHTYEGDAEPETVSVQLSVAPTADALAGLAGRDDVAAVLLCTVDDDPRVPADELRLILLTKQERTQRQAQPAGGGSRDIDPETAKLAAERDARRKRQEAEAAHYRKFVRTVATRKLKGTDVARWAMTYLLSIASRDVKATAASLLGLGDNSQAKAADAFDQAVADAGGAELLRIVVATMIADGSDYGFKPPADYGRGPALKPILTELGYEPLPPEKTAKR